MLSDISLFITIYLINIVLYFITFSWIVLLEKNKCMCCDNWKRHFLKYYLIFMVSYILISMVSFHLFKSYAIILEYMKYVIFVSELIYIAAVTIYIRDLLKNRCDCNQNNNTVMNKLYTDTDYLIIILSVVLFVSIAALRTS